MAPGEQKVDTPPLWPRSLCDSFALSWSRCSAFGAPATTNPSKVWAPFPQQLPNVRMPASINAFSLGPRPSLPGGPRGRSTGWRTEAQGARGLARSLGRPPVCTSWSFPWHWVTTECVVLVAGRNGRGRSVPWMSPGDGHSTLQLRLLLWTFQPAAPCPRFRSCWQDGDPCWVGLAPTPFLPLSLVHGVFDPHWGS